MTDRAALAALTAEIVECRRCPRLVAWREQVAREKVRRFSHETYWGRPVPGFGGWRHELVELDDSGMVEPGQALGLVR